MIQQGINQLLTSAGIFARLSPELEKKRELAGYEKQKGVARQALEVATRPEDRMDIQTDIEDITGRQFRLNPTEESYAEYSEERAKSRPTATTEIEADPEEIAQERAETILREREIERLTRQLTDPETVMQDLASRAETSIAQTTKRRRFMDYLRDEPTSLGGTVGELPAKLQRQIAKAYSRKERRELMDRKDRENQ